VIINIQSCGEPSCRKIKKKEKATAKRIQITVRESKQ
jgi:hypothetical protein